MTNEMVCHLSVNPYLWRMDYTSAREQVGLIKILLLHQFNVIVMFGCSSVYLIQCAREFGEALMNREPLLIYLIYFENSMLINISFLVLLFNWGAMVEQHVLNFNANEVDINLSQYFIYICFCNSLFASLYLYILLQKHFCFCYFKRQFRYRCW